MTREEAIEILEGLAVPISAETAFDMAIDALEQPELIRCKDCKHYRQYDDQDDLCVYTMTSVKADDYCSYAERNEGEQE